MNTSVVDAIDRTKNTEPAHWERTLAQRVDGPGRTGSYYPETTPHVLETLLRVMSWTPFEHPAIKAPARGFVAALDGVCDAVALAAVAPDTLVTLRVSDKDGTLYASRRSEGGELVETTTLLLGPGDGGDIVWTFHPGAPLPPCAVKPGGAHGFRGGERVSARAALGIGVTVLKYV